MTEISEALRGPWRAVLAWRDGSVVTLDDFDGTFAEPDEARILVVRGTAMPTDRYGDGQLRLASTYKRTDLLVDWDGEDCDDLAELHVRWEQAQAVAAALNGLAGEG